ncbi:uncharacterized protein MONBRDRAFT_25830 [Monosiga brevicollis MX1]|uniref:Uncharacterized protein n=1 Tax=Monosiga brevicollis TaxID=81824 RepID=A9V0K2_MONBE|nr:uncharacterized protein MONBRDRAFT_25830 [Monosiga brevicollis MX1]EDQ89167.1 predicted protein [Monosiga brevicollis MX1]|eukprot:XP_001746272.1 hypothetical protein [Monosiga brevicollis MX1]
MATTSTRASAAQGLGSINLWGFSPAQPVTAWLNSEQPSEDTSDTNILLLGAAQRRRHPNQRLKIYVIESAMELYARQLLFLKILTKPLEDLGLQDRAEHFLEIYGNTFVRASTHALLKELAADLLQAVTDRDALTQQLPFVHLDKLKYREIDALESIFKLWRGAPAETESMQLSWDFRLRSYYQQRYDNRDNLADWDYSMRLRDTASIIRSAQFLRWRRSGLAFEHRDADYEASNYTLASGQIVRTKEGREGRRSYFGDIVTSPYISYGLVTDKEDFYKRRNDIHVKSASDISLFNVMDMCAEMATGQRVQGEVDLDSPAPLKTVALEPELHDDVAGVEVFFLPLAATDDIKSKARFADLFDLIYVGNSSAQFVDAGLKHCLKAEGQLVIENVRHMVLLSAEQRQLYVDKTCLAGDIQQTADAFIINNTFGALVLSKLAINYVPRNASACAPTVTVVATVQASASNINGLMVDWQLNASVPSCFTGELSSLLWLSDLTMNMTEVQETFMPFLPGVIMTAANFQNVSSFPYSKTQDYPGRGCFADLFSWRLRGTGTHTPRFSLWALPDADNWFRVHPVALSVMANALDDWYYHRALAVALTAGSFYRAPVLRSVVGPHTIGDLALAWRATSNITNLPTARQKYGATFDALKKMVLMKVDAQELSRPFDQYPAVMKGGDLTSFSALNSSREPVYESYGPNSGIVSEPNSQRVQARVYAMLELFKNEIGVDYMFEDQIGARPWLRDFNPLSNQMQPGYLSAWLKHTQNISSSLFPLMTEQGFDKLLASEASFCGSAVSQQWLLQLLDLTSSYLQLSDPHEIFGTQNWYTYPFTAMAWRDVVVNRQHNLAGQTFDNNLQSMSFNLAHGYFLSYQITHIMNDQTLCQLYRSAAVIQDRVIAKYAETLATSFEVLDYLPNGLAGLTRTNYSSSAVVYRVATNVTTYSVAGFALPVYGFLVEQPESGAQTMTTTQYLGRPLNVTADAPYHILHIEPISSKILRIYHLLGCATPLTLDWAIPEDGHLNASAYNKDGQVVGVPNVDVNSTAGTVTLQLAAPFTGERAIDPTMIDFYQLTVSPAP